MARIDSENVIGLWLSDPTDAERTTLEFGRDGRLTYTIVGKDTDQRIFLTYRIEGGVLITDQPSHPRQERTRIEFSDDGKLILTHGTKRSAYVREARVASD